VIVDILILYRSSPLLLLIIVCLANSNTQRLIYNPKGIITNCKDNFECLNIVGK